MVDLLTQESDKNPGLLFLHDFKKEKKKKVIDSNRSFLLTILSHFIDIYIRFPSENPFQTWSSLIGIYAFTGHNPHLQSLGVTMRLTLPK